MLEMDNLKERLEEFRDAVVEESKANLKRQKKVSSGKLLNGIKGKEVVIYPSGSLEFEITMPLYGFFMDKGVKGTKSNYIENKNTPYSYKDKMPPPKKLDKWIVRKGIGRKGKGKGKFTSRKTLQFLIARSIFQKGLKASMFFTKPFEKHYKKLPTILAKAYGLDVAEFMRLQFLQSKQRAKK